MAYQLEVIRFRDLLPVVSIPGFVKGLSPLTIELRGNDFSSADKVLINEVKVPEFMIVNKTTIYAQLPDEMGSISSIKVISSKFSREIESAMLEFEIGDKTKRIDGILKLVQLFTKWILQSPGSDILTPTRGGGLQQIVGKVMTTKDLQPIFASVTRAINTTVSQIRAAQTNIPGLPLEERLLSANLVDVKIYEAHMQARASVSLQSMAGADALASLSL